MEDPHLLITSENMFGNASYTNTVHLGVRYTHDQQGKYGTNKNQKTINT
jgi:hypothetical protein